MKNLISLVVISITLFLACEKKDRDLNVSIKSNDYRVEITNEDSFNYENAELEINGKYKIKGVTIKAGETYKAYWSDFFDSDYNKFNPSSMSRQKFTIYCDIYDGSKGFFYGEK
jgi:major membrane immunogen (membrane-anchored lipoprotein)